MRPGAAREGTGCAALLAFALAVPSAGCGYRFAARGDGLPGGVDAARVVLFSNRTAEPGVESWFTEAFRGELARRGREAGEGAAAVVSGEVTRVAVAPSIFPAVPRPGQAIGAGAVASYRAEAVATVRLERGGARLAEVTVTGFEDFLPGGSVLDSEANRRLALRRLAESLMRQAYLRLASGP